MDCRWLKGHAAPQFGFDPANVAVYNNNFRNVVLVYLSPERLAILY